MVMDAPGARDRVSLEVPATVVGQDVVDDALVARGIPARRPDLMVSVILALALALSAGRTTRKSAPGDRGVWERRLGSAHGLGDHGGP
jgi:hypothetical protein